MNQFILKLIVCNIVSCYSFTCTAYVPVFLEVQQFSESYLCTEDVLLLKARLVVEYIFSAQNSASNSETTFIGAYQ